MLGNDRCWRNGCGHLVSWTLSDKKPLKTLKCYESGIIEPSYFSDINMTVLADLPSNEWKVAQQVSKNVFLKFHLQF